ncbi:MAG TPA: hypothetical protein VGE08_13800 [Steroidobacter sp.]|uniref:serine O-acetyltransferase n=1 Tax=Steroidobacter sp. TaxID=1978227 RepID=UPI002ED9B08A
MSFVQTIKADIARYARERPVRFDVATLLLVKEHYGLQAVLVYRLGQALLSKKDKVLWWPLVAIGSVPYVLLAAWMRFGYGIDLRPSAQIGAGLYIGHLGGIRVANCRIGSGCSIAQRCQIGAPDGPGPLIGDRVWVGAHARILGAINIADGVTISAGCHIARDLPARVLVAGNPGRITLRDYDNSRLL